MRWFHLGGRAQPVSKLAAARPAEVGSAPTAAIPRVRTLESLNDPAFAWFFASTVAQMAAVFMQMLVRNFLVYEMTGSYAILGLLNLLSAVPQLIFGLYGGVLADRFPKKLVTQVGQAVGLLNVLAMAALALFGVLAVWHLIVSGVVSGLLVGMMMPARQSMVHEIVKGERLMNAISLQTGGTNITQIAAPAAGGFLLAFVGAGGTFLTMGVCYALAILAMTRIPTVPAAQRGANGAGAAVRDIIAGLRYVRGSPELRMVLLLSFFVALLGSAYMPILAGFVQDVFEGGSTMVGVLTSVSAVGSLAGALVLASLPERRRGLMLILSAAALGVGLLALSVAGAVWLAAIFMVIVGIGQAGRQSLSNTLLQAYSETAYRGRVMALFMTQFSVMSIGAFLVGIIAGEIGVRWAFGGMAAGLIAIAALTLVISPRLRRLD